MHKYVACPLKDFLYPSLTRRFQFFCVPGGFYACPGLTLSNMMAVY